MCDVVHLGFPCVCLTENTADIPSGGGPGRCYALSRCALCVVGAVCASLLVSEGACSGAAFQLGKLEQEAQAQRRKHRAISTLEKRDQQVCAHLQERLCPS